MNNMDDTRSRHITAVILTTGVIQHHLGDVIETAQRPGESLGCSSTVSPGDAIGTSKGAHPEQVKIGGEWLK